MKLLKLNLSFFFILSITLFGISCNKDTSNNNSIGLNNQINNLPKEPLSADELATLPFMREEEKLARDVYSYLYSKWQVNIFNNISSSEQTHTDAVLNLLSKYNLPDPVNNNPPGIFTNSLLQNLYNQLIQQGSLNLNEGLKVGATIEDLDIFDLKTALTKIDNQDIRLVYENLMKGSRNHLRSFYSNILSNGGTYLPQYISQSEFDAIINSPMETGGNW